ncbi:MAG TPA: sigma-54 dependent transcriptional regulator [Anaeromyxobacteraceae bacterium]|nr:sigma-54 dependent transcriptional regulator [Anaeromyxobacteraceae bacterium]
MKIKGRILLLDDDDLIVSMLARSLKREGYEVQAETDPEGILAKIRSFAPHVVLLDLKLPGASGMDILREIVDEGVDAQVVMLTSDDSAESAVKAMKVGAKDYLTKPFDLEEVKLVVASLLEQGSLKQEVGYLRKISSDLNHRDLIGTSEAVRRVKESAEKLAKAGVLSVLITGENGTGKEMVARYVHDLMHRGDGGSCAPFIGINCAALPEELIESELFGHEKGAFTDAKVEKKGIFELAAGGTVLLDEIGEMKWNLQAKLLRALEEWKVRRVGGRHDIPIEATVFATTNRNLEEAVKNGEFRIDLYYRLATFCLAVPPLRERREDIIPIAQHFLSFFAAKYGRAGPSGFSQEAREFLLAYDWPGNVRELRNTVERFVVLESGPTVLPDHLPKEILQRKEPLAPAAPAAGAGFTLPEGGLSLEDLESTLILQALAKTGRNKAQAAKLLGITYDSFRYQVKKLGLD